LVRFFNEVRQSLPAILIVDAGVNAIPHTLGLIDNATNYNGKWQGHYVIYREVPLSIVVATRDQETTDNLSSLLSLMFNELRNLAGGNRMTGNELNGDRWVVTLSNEPPSQTATVPANITDDPKDRIWHTTVDMPIRFEDKIIVEKEMPTLDRPGAPFPMEENISEKYPPEIIFPDILQINTQAKLFVHYLQDQHKIAINDPSVATVNPQNFIVTPRRPGTFKIQVFDLRDTEGPATALAPKVVSEKEVSVIL
jgi:hypothetical protein